MDRLTRQVLDWINDRRQAADLDPLDDLRATGVLFDDPISGSLHPEAHWVLGSLQYTDANRIIQIPSIPDYVHRWLREWHAGAHPDY